MSRDKNGLSIPLVFEYETEMLSRIRDFRRWLAPALLLGGMGPVHALNFNFTAAPGMSPNVSVMVRSITPGAPNASMVWADTSSKAAR